MTKRPTGLDASQLARRIVAEAAGEEPVAMPPKPKDANAIKAGKLGGKLGSAKRNASLTAEQRQEIAKLAAAARWKTP